MIRIWIGHIRKGADTIVLRHGVEDWLHPIPRSFPDGMRPEDLPFPIRQNLHEAAGLMICHETVDFIRRYLAADPSSREIVLAEALRGNATEMASVRAIDSGSAAR